MILSTAVMTHAARRTAAEELARRAPRLDAEVVEDPGAGSTLVTAGAAWSTVSDAASHHLLLQDDVVLADRFKERVAALVASAPDAAISLFCEWGSRTATRVRVAALADEVVAPVVDGYVPTQGVVLPARWAREFADHAAAMDPRLPDDVALREFLVNHGVRHLVAVPNLVEHDDVCGMPSLTGNSFQGVRRSACFVSADVPTSPTMPCAAFRRLTHVGWMRATAEVFEDDRFAPDEFAGTPVAAALPTALDQERLMAAFTRTLAYVAHRHGPLLTQLLDVTVLFEVWVAWYANGLGARLGAGAAAEDRLGPVARTALESVLPGVLRRYVPVSTLASVRAHGVTLVLSALRAGAAEAPDVRAAWISGQR